MQGGQEPTSQLRISIRARSAEKYNGVILRQSPGRDAGRSRSVTATTAVTTVRRAALLGAQAAVAAYSQGHVWRHGRYR